MKTYLNVIRLATLMLTCVGLASCGGGGGGGGTSDTTQPPPPPPPSSNRGTLLQDVFSVYPRLVRLANQADTAKNGRIISSVTQDISGIWQAGIHSSSDGGTTFTRIGAVLDTEFQKGLCCGTLFEMPQTVGTIARGTLLYSGSIGADVAGTLMEHRIYRSTDAGVTWTRIDNVNCGRSTIPRVVKTIGSGIYEPEFFIAGDGSLACIYSDETQSGSSQVLRLTKTSDGNTWSAPATVVQGTNANDRPGMAVVRRLPSGKYFMSFEACSLAALDCSVRTKLSDDGLNWGTLGTLGTRAETASGQFFRHAPTNAWTAVAGQANGMIVLVGQILVAANGTPDASGNGKSLFVNTSSDGSGPWKLVAAPLTLPSPPLVTNFCQNYSTALLPSTDGTRVLMLQSDGGADATCRSRFGSGTVSP
jgi:hypothetical protein